MGSNKIGNLKDQFDRQWIPEPFSGCWLWIGATSKRRYGSIRVGGRKGKTKQSHRVAYELYVAPIPARLRVCHTCDTPSCVNPDHLFVGTDKDNILDASRKGRMMSGENHIDAKLNWAKVAEIRASSGASLRTLARQYGVGYRSIAKVLNNESWRCGTRKTRSGCSATVWRVKP